MADAALLRTAAKKVVACLLVVAIGHYLLWPDEAVRDWLGHNIDWKIKFAFVAWVAVSIGMAYDALVALGKGVMAAPDDNRR
ncbi:MAG: hypothetical protein ACREO3_09385 [Arenimonas sp.]